MNLSFVYSSHNGSSITYYAQDGTRLVYHITGKRENDIRPENFVLGGMDFEHRSIYPREVIEQLRYKEDKMDKMDIEDKIFRQKLKLERLEENRKNIERKSESIEKEIEGLEKKLEELNKPMTIYNIQPSDRYYYIDVVGDIVYDVWTNHKFDRTARTQRKAFLSEEEAKDEKRRLNLIEKARISQKSFVVNSENKNKKYYYIWLNIFGYVDTGCVYDYILRTELGEWEYKEDAEQFIEENKPELEWYFGIGDE